MVLQKPFHIFFIFLAAQSTGTVNQYTAVFDVFCRLFEDLTLDAHQCVNFTAVFFQTDVRFLPQKPQPGTRHICQHAVISSNGRSVFHRSISDGCFHNGNTQTLSTVSNEFRFMFVNITGVDFAAVFHAFRHGECFPAGRAQRSKIFSPFWGSNTATAV